MSDTSSQPDAPAPGRRRLVLKPRDETAVRAAEQARQESLHKANPFGAAKPKEAVLAERTGKSEQEILVEAAKRDRGKLRLNAQQQDEKEAAEEAIQDIQFQISAEHEDAKKQLLQEELKRKEDALDALLGSFEKLYLEQAQRGEVQRPSERRQLLDAEPGRGGQSDARQYPSYNSGREGGRDGDSYSRGQYGGQQDDFGSGFERRGGGGGGGGGGFRSGGGGGFGGGGGASGEWGRNSSHNEPVAERESYEDYPGMGPGSGSAAGGS